MITCDRGLRSAAGWLPTSRNAHGGDPIGHGVTSALESTRVCPGVHFDRRFADAIVAGEHASYSGVHLGHFCDRWPMASEAGSNPYQENYAVHCKFRVFLSYLGVPAQKSEAPFSL